MFHNQVSFCIKQEPEICEAGKITNTFHWIHPDRTMECNVFLLITNGVFRVEEDTTKYVLKKNDVFFLKSGLHHTSQLYSDDGTSWYYVHFYDAVCSDCKTGNCILHSPSQMISKPEQLLLPKKITLSPYEADKVSIAMQEMCIKYSSPSPLVKARLNLELKKLFLNLLELDMSSKNELRTSIANRIMDLIDSSTIDLSSKEISERLELNYEYLSRTFSKETGFTISQYKNHVKIQKAIYYLKTENLTISEIAEKCGFENQFYFSRVFKNVTGLSPTAYVKNVYVQNSNCALEEDP